MLEGQSICVVVPAYNEETQVGRVIDTMPPFVDKIVVVDDASLDRTSEVVKTLQESDPRVVLLVHPKNKGVGGAISTGYKWARDNDMDIAVVMAGDGQMDPDDLPDLLDPIIKDQVDYTKGNRLISGEAYKKIPKLRYFGNAALSMLTKIASGYWHVTDSQTGYTAANKQVLHTIDWDATYQRYGQPNDLLVRLNVMSFRVADVEVEPVYGVGERSGIKISRVIFSVGWLLIKLFFWRLKEKYIIRDFHPLLFFYALGFLLLLASLILFIRLIVLWVANSYLPEVTLLFWLFANTMGMLCIFFAMWFDMEYNLPLKGSGFSRRTRKYRRDKNS
ncbi:glycosyltransferase family 2 protein [Desulfoferula mesophila]|uniref:Glycosyltransferase 2-like domain-containing protein n=1 Tax=Desulfoferula mesophila TaxID=3058419 RepID=A0AAU9EC13_9BACT|nr:hypothetical protein FAK_05860 [Desulfoferula mesophilus]